MNLKHSKDLMVSVITMTYKKFEGLERTILSVSKQSFANIEFIISDDGSDNFSYAKIDELVKKYNIVKYRILHSESNIGTVANANIACRASNGDIVMFLSSGDMFAYENVVSDVVGRFVKNDSDLLCVRRIAFRDEPCYFLPHMCSIPIIKSFSDRDRQYKAFITTHYWDMASGSATYYSKRILEKFGYFDEKYRLWEDGPFYERFLREYKLDFAYDLIAVWYELGGVSTGKVHPLLEKDRLQFDKTDRLFFKNKLDGFTNQYIEYIHKRSDCNDRYSLMKLRLHYPIVMVSHVLYKVLNVIFEKIDKVYLRFNKKWQKRFAEVTK